MISIKSCASLRTSWSRPCSMLVKCEIARTVLPIWTLYPFEVLDNARAVNSASRAESFKILSLLALYQILISGQVYMEMNQQYVHVRVQLIKTRQNTHSERVHRSSDCGESPLPVGQLWVASVSWWSDELDDILTGTFVEVGFSSSTSVSKDWDSSQASEAESNSLRRSSILLASPSTALSAVYSEVLFPISISPSETSSLRVLVVKSLSPLSDRVTNWGPSDWWSTFIARRGDLNGFFNRLRDWKGRVSSNL